MLKICISFIVWLLTLIPSLAIDTSNIGKVISPFKAPTAQGNTFSFEQFPEAKAIAIVFTCNHCPFAELYIRRMNDFHREFAPLGIPLIAINPMDSLLYEDETLDEMQNKINKDSIVYPYLQDHTQSIARMFNAAYTPQVFVIRNDSATWRIVYQGIIDDNGKFPELATPHLKNTAKAILSNLSIPKDVIASFGCKINYRSP
ncbi:MAG: redoxin domain-containing protein [bacterium]